MFINALKLIFFPSEFEILDYDDSFQDLKRIFCIILKPNTYKGKVKKTGF